MIKFFTWLSVLLGPDPSSNKNKAQKNSEVARFANFHSQLSVNWIKCSPSNQRIKCGVFLTSQWGRLFTFFVRCENFEFCRSVIKEFAHAFSCTYIELWVHLGSLESTQKPRVALGCASSYSYAFFVPSKLPAYIHKSM